MPEEKKIALKFSRENFEEIYNLKEYSSIIRNRHTRVYFWMLIALGIVFPVSLFYSISENKFVVLSIMLFIWFILAVVALYAAAMPYIRWVKKVVTYIKTFEKYKMHELILTENSMELIQDETHTLERWSSIANIRIEPEYLVINGSSQYIFPRKSMTEAEFEYLKTIAVNKIR